MNAFSLLSLLVQSILYFSLRLQVGGVVPLGGGGAGGGHSLHQAHGAADTNLPELSSVLPASSFEFFLFSKKIESLRYFFL